jgi:hypothetical protein
MKIIPGHVQNINGITPTEAVAPVSRAEKQHIELGLMQITPAQLAIESTIQLRVLPVHEKYMPKLTIREHKRVSEFARWFMTLGRTTPLIIQSDDISKLECSRFGGYNSPTIGMDNANHWYDKDFDRHHRITRTNQPIRATLLLGATATVPEFDDIAVHVDSKYLMLSAPNSPLEKSGMYGFNMVYMEEL